MQVKIPRTRVDGLLILDKPLGLSSNQALQKVKWLLKAKKGGHTGNLDPLATGVLPLAFGEATKFASYGLDADKTYQTTIQLGEERSTGDAEGEVTASFPIPELNEQFLLNTLEQFKGAQQQVPPMYSALKVDGQKLYQLARAGVTLERQPRPIHIYKLTLLSFTASSITLEVHCSKGTYIRVLGEDIARALGTGGYLSNLRRTQAGSLNLVQACSLEELIKLEEQGGAQAVAQKLYPADYLIEHLSRTALQPEEAQAVQHGQAIKLLDTSLAIGENTRLYLPSEAQNQFLGLGQVQESAQGLVIQPVKMLASS